MDHTEIHVASAPLAHLIDLFVFQGAPSNANEDHPVQILINHGSVVGYSPSRLQPLWAAYRVAHADRWVDYKRPHLYYADKRLEEEHRLGPETFGKLNGTQLNVGHMVPNEAINRQFGRLAQLETFFMSNMSPQFDSLNSGVWLKLENAIRDMNELAERGHVWAITGPVFSSSPDAVERPDGKKVPVPEAYYCVTIDPHRYPYDRLSNVDIACFLIPQTAPKMDSPLDYLSGLDEVQDRTGLSFVPGFTHLIGETLKMNQPARNLARHRLISQLMQQADTV